MWLTYGKSPCCPIMTSLRLILIAGLSITSRVVLATLYRNPVLPGFHPDPSCVRVEEWDNTFFCATSSFNAVPGVPIFASKDLQNFKQIGELMMLLMSVRV